MGKKNKSSDGALEEPDLNFTSMIDIVFLLLIFFMVATQFKQPERRLDAKLPTDEGQMQAKFDPKKPEELSIFVMDDRDMRNSSDFKLRAMRNATFYLGARKGKKTKDPNDFYPELKKRAVNPEQEVLIALYSESEENQDQKVPFQNIIKLLDVCKRAGITKIKFQAPAQH